MARQEATNSFTEGLITDLHPLNTPNTVLTDCLNGTLITYNGNEFILQNDMGNYELKNCKLPVNFIPVGIKGYADILYIVSYNPLTEYVEIGSYPAPQSIFSTEDSQKKTGDADLVPFYFGNEYPTANTYNDIIAEQKHAVFIFMDGANEESTKLYPGDEFSIDGLEENYLDDLFIYQHLNFYVIDENNKLYDIDDDEIYLGSPTESDYRKVFWETPGWLAAQYDLYVPDKFNLNLRSLNLPEFILDSTTQKDDKKLTASIDLSTQLIISDPLFINKLNERKNTNTFKDLYIRFLVNDPEKKIPGSIFTSNGNTYVESVKSPDNPTDEEKDENILIYDIPCEWHNYQDDILTAYVNWSPTWNFKMPQLDNGKYNLTNYEVKVVAYPIIKYKKDDVISTLKYTQFRTELHYELNNLKNVDEINIGNSIYKWSVDDNSCTISFNIDGPFVNASNIRGKYNIYRLNYFYKKAALPNPDLYSESSWQYLRDDSIDYKDSEGEDDSCLLATKSPNNRLLMMSGEISNLSLFGQNTINLYYKNSKSYSLTEYKNCVNYQKIQGSGGMMCSPIKNPDPKDTSKHLKFEKEGGIYMFEVILQQGPNENADELAKQEFLLIPSILFNDWFGELDNYLTSITSSQWLGKYLDNLNISSIINNISINFKDSEDSEDSESKEAFKLKYGNNTSVTFNPNPSEDTDDILLEQIRNACDNPSQSYEWASMPNQFTYEIDVSKLIKSVTTDNTTLDFTPLSGNLWNPIINGNFSLYTNTGDLLLTKDINTGEWTFSKKITYNWNVENSNSRQKNQGEKVYPFSKILTKSPGGSYPDATDTGVVQILAYGGSRSKSSVYYRTYVKCYPGQTMKQITYNIASDKQNYNMDSNEVQHIGKILTEYGVRWGIVDFYRQDESTGQNWRGYWVKDSDDNPDRAFTEKLPISDNHVNEYYIVLFAGNGDYIKYPQTTIALKFKNDNERQDFVSALFHIIAYNYSEESRTVYYPEFNVSNLIETESVSLNKMELVCNLNLLRVDDENWLDPSIYLTNLNSKLIEKPQILLSKNQTTSFSNTLVTIKYTDAHPYKMFVQKVTGWFDSYNKTAKSESSFTNYVGTNLDYDPDVEDWVKSSTESSLWEWFPNLTINASETQENRIKTIANKIIQSLGRWNIELPYTRTDNIVFKNTNFGTYKIVCAKINDAVNSTTDDSGCFFACYWQDWSNE